MELSSAGVLSIPADGGDLTGVTNAIHLGASADMKIFHNGGNNFILTDQASQSFTVLSDIVRFNTRDNGESLFGATLDGGFFAKFDNSTTLQTISGGVQIDGDLVFGGSGNGVNLGVTSNTDSNTLDDYEEGTFTFGTNANLTLNSSSNVGKYTKIGRVVHIQATLDVSSVSGTNHVYFTSLPFTNGSHGSSTLNGWGIGNVSLYNVNFDDNANYHYAVIDAGSTNAYIYASKDNANWDILTNSELTNSAEIGMNLTYFV